MGFILLDHLPTGYQEGYLPLVYNSKSFLASNNELPQFHFYWVEKNEKVAYAHVAFSLEESEASSPLKAPFGGVEHADELKSADLCAFLIFVERELKTKGVKYINISQPPGNHGNQKALNEVFNDLKYKIMSERIFHAVPISEKDFTSKMSVMEQRRLNKCVKAGFEFKSIASTKLSEVYNAIATWRGLTQKPLSMEWKVLSHTRKSNPDMYVPFGVYDDKKLIAATIAIQVNSKVLYHFYPAHCPEYNNYSPMVMLVDGLYKWCQTHQIELLDLGTSYVNNKMNQSLVRFKKHLGGEESKALLFRKVLTLHQIK